MHFIKEIEKSKKQYVEANSILNENKFYYYMDIKFSDEIDAILSQTFKILKKGDTTQIIMVDKSSGIKTYLSDFDIINILVEECDIHTDVVKEVLRDLVELIKGNSEELSFAINQVQSYDIKGIPLKESTEMLIDIYTDITINLNDLIILINLVIEKERYSSKPQNLEGTLVKIIILTMYYGNIYKLESKYNISQILAEYDIDVEKNLYHNREKITTKKGYKLLIPYQKIIGFVEQLK